MSKIITVFGATGKQGGSVIRTILQDANLSQEFKIRGITRDATKPEAQALSKKGVEFGKADMNSKESLVEALQGSHSVFLVTTPAWGVAGSDAELAHGKNVADAAKETGAQHLIFSSLVNVTETSGGRLKHVPHFDQKAQVEQYIRSIGVPATFVLPGYFMTNYTEMGMLRKGEDGVYTLAYPVSKDAKFPLVDIENDLGKYVAAALKNRAESLGAQILAAADYYTPTRILEEFEEATGQKTRFVQVDSETYTSFLPATIAEEMLENHLFIENRLLQRRKVKCDQKRPVCSRCHEGGFACVYSSSKKRPGPARGTRKAAKRTVKSPAKAAHSFVSPEQDNGEHVSSFFSDIFVASSATGFELDADAGFSTGDCTSQPMSLLSGLTPIVPTAGLSGSTELGISPEMQAKLVHDFFDFVHYSIPLFRKEDFLEQYEHGTINHSLLLTVLAVTAKSLGLPHGWQVANIDDCLQELLKNDPLEGPTQPALLLDAFRQNCLLAFYRFHQGHGGDAWDYISRLSRKALRLGLHQLDSTDRYNSVGDALASPANLEEWRYVWWCIYCLDSYSNITAATPFVVEKESIRTALVATSLQGSGDNRVGSHGGKFLPPDTRDLWRISAEMGDLNIQASCFNMHIVTTTLLREAAAIYRLRRQNPSEGLRERRSQFGDHLSAVVLSLPPQFLREARNAFANESSVDHHARLVCLLHLHTARLLNAITFDPSDDSMWTTSWQRSLAHSEDIVAVIREWDSRYCSTVDPAICLIVFSTLILLYLHEMHEATPKMPALSERLQAERNILLLFLEQFARIWALPRSLKAAFEEFTSAVHGPLSSHDIGQLLTRVPGPFRPWRGLLGLSPNPQDPLLTPQEPGLDLPGLGFTFDFLSPL
ncbi:transcription factor domain-containing protein [Aspergillus thermomutatus]|uniref:Xylanolytic transcriptional activator regulatory domain-containing protein n=1 Tax=Aspergillus thermomutatus TaxID=41047 RepID=A0A397GK00_ASPTH|nr:uncharacterized protein CDV56_103515 [Aspergillus thermomutatus]RHZ50509.1 hypothetical protein CDV56_103515 [Aspergillus thermomutatus]